VSKPRQNQSSNANSGTKHSVKLTLDDAGARHKVKYINTSMREHNTTAAVTVGKRASFLLMQYTKPVSSSSHDWPTKGMNEMIHQDASNAYKVRGEYGFGSAAYQLIKNSYGKDKADAWYRDFMSSGKDTSENFDRAQRDDAMVQFEKLRKIPRKVDETRYNDIRRMGGGWRYPKPERGKEHPWLGVVTQDKRDKLEKSRRRSVGLAKAGWFATFKILGGRGLKGGKAGYGDRTAQTEWPSQIKVPYKLFGGMNIGGVQGGITKSGFRVTLNNKIRYADDAFIPDARSRVSKLVETYMKMIFDLRKKHMKEAMNKRQSTLASRKVA
jgi:hypothetical protein